MRLNGKQNVQLQNPLQFIDAPGTLEQQYTCVVSLLTFLVLQPDPPPVGTEKVAWVVIMELKAVLSRHEIIANSSQRKAIRKRMTLNRFYIKEDRNIIYLNKQETK